MKKRSRIKYVVLQEYIPASAQKAIKRSVRAVLPRINAPTSFCRKTESGPYNRSTSPATGNPSHTLRTYGLLGGSALSVAGGFLIWFLIKKQRESTPMSVGMPPSTKTTHHYRTSLNFIKRSILRN